MLPGIQQPAMNVVAAQLFGHTQKETSQTQKTSAKVVPCGYVRMPNSRREPGEEGNRRCRHLNRAQCVFLANPKKEF
jgi:hypothetical protein